MLDDNDWKVSTDRALANTESILRSIGSRFNFLSLFSLNFSFSAHLQATSMFDCKPTQESFPHHARAYFPLAAAPCVLPLASTAPDAAHQQNQKHRLHKP